MNKEEVKRMANTCENYHSCALCPYNPEDISRFIGDRWKGGCPNYDRKIVYSMGKGYRKVDDDEIVIKADTKCVDSTTAVEAIEFFVKHNAKVRQEAVKEFAKIVVSAIWEEKKGEKIKIKDVHDTIRDILRMHFDIDLEDNDEQRRNN